MEATSHSPPPRSAEGMLSTEEKVSGQISIPEPCTPIGGTPFYHRNIILLARDFNVPDLNGAVLFAVLASVLYALLTPWLLWLIAGQPMTFVWTPHSFPSHTPSSAPSAYQRRRGHWLSSSGTPAADVAANLPVRDEEQEKIRGERVFFACFVKGIASVFFVARVAWLVLSPASTEFDDSVDEPLGVVLELSMITLFLAWIWSADVALALLEEALVSFDTLFGKGLVCFVPTWALCIAFMAVKCYAASLLVMWTVAMTVFGFFGYCLAVYARCKYIQSRKKTVSSSLSDDGPNKLLDEPDQKPAVSLLQELGDHNEKLGLHILVDDAR